MDVHTVFICISWFSIFFSVSFTRGQLHSPAVPSALVLSCSSSRLSAELDWLCLEHHHSKILSGWWNISRYNVTCCSSFSTQMPSSVGRIKKKTTIEHVSLFALKVFSQMGCGSYFAQTEWVLENDADSWILKDIWERPKGSLAKSARKSQQSGKCEWERVWPHYGCASWRQCRSFIVLCRKAGSGCDMTAGRKRKWRLNQAKSLNVDFRITRGKKGQDETKEGRCCLLFLSG